MDPSYQKNMQTQYAHVCTQNHRP